MKCDELTPIDLECNFGKDINGVEHREPWKAYDIDEVKAAIAELKAENESLKAKLAEKDEEIDKQKWRGDEWAKACNQKDKEIESLKASHYAESVDAGMRERKLKYKRCLAMAKYCEAMRGHYLSYEEPKWFWYRKWSERWLELAETKRRSTDEINAL